MADEIRDRVEDLKQRLLELSIAGKKSLEDTARAMREVADITADVKGIEDDDEARKARSEATNEFKTDLKTALAEVKQDQKSFYDEQKRMSTEASKVRQQQVKAASAAEKAELVKLRNAHREYVKITQQGFGVMSNAARQYGQNIQRIKNIITQTAQRTGQSWQQVAQRMQQLGVPTMQINQALKQLNTVSTQAQGGIQGLIQRLTNLGGVGQFVFGSILGFTAITVLQRVTRAFVDFAKEILQRGTEMTEVIFTLEVAIRGLQRVGLDTTIEGWTERIQDLKKEFPFFPKREFIEGASLAALMTREFGFTESQIAELVRQASILAQITGKDLLESVRGITFAIGSGYFESLQRAGVNISRAVVANEALAQGYEGVYNELEPTIRASVTYSVIQNNLNAIQDDASRKVETFAGQVQILTSRLEDLQNLFGEVVTSSDSLIDALEVVNELLAAISDVYETLSRANIDIFAPMKELLGINLLIENIEILTDTLEGLSKAIDGVITAAQTLGTVFRALGSVAGAFGLDVVQQALDSISETIFNVSRRLDDLSDQEEIDIPIKISGFTFSEEEYREIVEVTQEIAEEVEKIEEESAQKRIDIMEDWARDTANIRETHNQKMLDLAQDLADKLADIDLKEQQKITDEITTMNLELQK
jgi:phosphohistidine phosphatase SixA